MVRFPVFSGDSPIEHGREDARQGHRRLVNLLGAGGVPPFPALPAINGIWDIQYAAFSGPHVVSIPSSGIVNKTFVQREGGAVPTNAGDGWIRVTDAQHLHFLNAEDVIGNSGYLAYVARDFSSAIIGNQVIYGGYGDNPVTGAFNAGIIRRDADSQIVIQVRDSGGAKQASAGAPAASTLYFHEMRWNGTIAEIRTNFGSWSQVAAGPPTNLNEDMQIGPRGTSTAIFEAALFLAHDTFLDGAELDAIRAHIESRWF
jgi:hypothetical protein